MQPGTSRLKVARILIQAPTTSFRYPHFLIGRQPTFDMPPPSTIYGHVCSAVGELLPPKSLRFGYDFRFVSKASDLEHQHIITPGGPRQGFEVSGQRYDTSVEATIQPHLRDFLFRPQLTLYLDQPDLADAFRSPQFPVVLGRSQDIAQVVRAEQIELESQPGAYFEHTLLPFEYRRSIGFGTTVLMPRHIGPPPVRPPRFDRFIALHDRVFGGEIESPAVVGIRKLLQRENDRPAWWVDASTPRYHGVHRAVVFHPFDE